MVTWSLELLALGGGAFLTVLVVGASAMYWRRSRPSLDEQLDALLEKNEDDEPIAFRPPDVRRSIFDVIRVTRHYQRAQRLAKRGYVRWYRLGSTMSRPEWVKPEQKGSGVPKVTVDGQPYYFEKEAMVSDELTGAWVAMHREGEADPMNLRDPAYPGIPVDLMERTINLEAESKPPGWLDGLAVDQQTMMYLAIGVLFVIYAFYRYAGGAA